MTCFRECTQCNTYKNTYQPDLTVMTQWVKGSHGTMIHLMSYFTRLELPSRCLRNLFTGQPGCQSESTRRNFHKNKRNKKHYVLWVLLKLRSTLSPTSGVTSLTTFFLPGCFSIQMTGFMGIGPSYFPRWLYQFTYLPAVYEGSFSPQPRQHLLLLVLQLHFIFDK